MFEHTSRYYGLEVANYRMPSERVLVYVRRRFLPPPTASEVVVEHTVTEGERLDNITARYVGNPELFWQLCDINDVMHPAELTAEIGRKVLIGIQQR